MNGLPTATRLRRWGLLAALAVCVTAGLVALDLLVDPERPGPAEFAVDVFETLLLVGAMTLVASFVPRIEGIERETDHFRLDLARARRDGEDWRRRSRMLMEGLSEAISAQFDAWGLTPAEADIAGLMLKGLPLREIAGLRRTSEATIRQQAQGIYRKSGLANRAELSAYFLEDLYDVAAMGRDRPEPAPIN